MAGKNYYAYMLKEWKKKEVLKGEKIYWVAEQIGLEQHYLTNILNRRMAVKHKAMAYAITKWTNSNYEIPDLFEVKAL